MAGLEHKRGNEVGLSDSAVATLRRAVIVARYYRHEYVGTEHLLYSLFSEGEVAKDFQMLGISGIRLELAFEIYVGQGPTESFGDDLAFTPGLLTVVQKARENALQNGKTRVCPRDLFFSLVEKIDDPGAIILLNLFSNKTPDLQHRKKKLLKKLSQR